MKPNQIHDARIQQTRLSPAEAELRLTITVGHAIPEVGVRARIVGPRCRYASTIEVAYPFRQVQSSDPSTVALRCVIPEPSLWEPQCPFLYEAQIEFHAYDGSVHRCSYAQGLRSVTFSGASLRLNGHPLYLDAIQGRRVDETRLQEWRRLGLNAVVVELISAEAGAWDLADQIGFLVLGIIRTESGLEQARHLSTHPSAVGWMLPSELLAQLPLNSGTRIRELGSLTGVEIGGPLPRPKFGLEAGATPERVDFVVCPRERLADLSEVSLPKLVVEECQPRPQGCEPSSEPGIIGQVWRETT